MKHLLKKILIPIIERRLVLPLLAFAAGLPSFPALALEAVQVTAPAAAAQSEQLPAGFTGKSATVNGVRINYKIGGQGPAVVLLHRYTQTSHNDGMRAGFDSNSANHPTSHSITSKHSNL